MTQGTIGFDSPRDNSAAEVVQDCETIEIGRFGRCVGSLSFEAASAETGPRYVTGGCAAVGQEGSTRSEENDIGKALWLPILVRPSCRPLQMFSDVDSAETMKQAVHAIGGGVQEE